ncbi:MAG: hypothetical protein H0T39_13830 [Actinobacteria bacterium]|nr:hypothetical protein [Actinomycetota bacterium]
MARNILVLTTVSVDVGPITRQVQEAAGGDSVNVRVVTPAVKQSPMQWLTNEEDDARIDAGQTAEAVAEALPVDGEVQTEVGDSDPVQAIEDALRTFPADEIVVATRPGKDATWLEQGSAERAFQQFNLPVRRLTIDEK